MHTATIGRSGLYFPSLTDLFNVLLGSLTAVFKEDDKPKEPVSPGEVVTLEELKKRNQEQDEEEGADEDDDQEDPDDDDQDDDSDEDDSDGEEEDSDEDDDDADSDDDDEEDEEDDDAEGDKDKKKPAWMLDEEGKEPDEKKFSDKDAAAIRRKYQGKLDKEKDEKEQLKAKLKEYESGKAPAKAPAVDTSDIKEPKRADFEAGEKGMEKYLEARQDYKLAIQRREMESQQHAAELEAQQQKQTQQVEAEVNQHYDRAHSLVKKSGIKPEQYKAADNRVREALDEKFPGAGDAVLDNLIAELGEGSERVVYNLGVNEKRLNEFLDSFDRRGFKAFLYLERLNARLKDPTNRESKAPKAPPKTRNGDKKASASQSRNLKRAYQDAHARNDGQKAFNLKRQAKEAGIDVSKW